MYASASFHDIRSIVASSTRTAGAPLTLALYGARHESCTVTLFTDSQAYTDRLIAAINGAGGYPRPTDAEPATSEPKLHPDDYRE